MSTDFQFAVTLFQNLAATQKCEQKFTLHDLADLARTASAARKELLPLWKLARFWNLRTIKGSLRHDANVLAITGIEADYDGGRMAFDDAAEVLGKLGITALIYTSPSHADDAPRWRVLCPLSEQMAPGERIHMLGRLNGAFRGIFSRESWTLSQSYYYGSVRHNPVHRVQEFVGTAIDQLDDLDGAGWMGPPKATAITGTARASAEAVEDAELIRRVVTGDGYHVELCALAARYIGRGVSAESVRSILQGIMLAHPEPSRDQRWQERYEDIGNLVGSAGVKYAKDARQRRAIARMTHRLIDARATPEDIASAISVEAERVGLSITSAMNVADRVCAARAAGAADGRR